MQREGVHPIRLRSRKESFGCHFYDIESVFPSILWTSLWPQGRDFQNRVYLQAYELVRLGYSTYSIYGKEHQSSIDTAGRGQGVIGKTNIMRGELVMKSIGDLIGNFTAVPREEEYGEQQC